MRVKALLARGIARVASARLANGRFLSDSARTRGGRTTPFGSYGGLAPEVEAADLSRDSLSKLGVTGESPVYEQFTEASTCDPSPPNPCPTSKDEVHPPPTPPPSPACPRRRCRRV